MNWELAANMATVITSISIFFAMLQLVKEMRKESWEAFFYLHQYLSQDQFGEARKKVRTELYKLDYDKWTEEDITLANRVCSSYDQAGILLSQNLLTKKSKRNFLCSSWGNSIIDQYEALEPYLDDMQTPTQTGREFFKHFTWLYNEKKRDREKYL